MPLRASNYLLSGKDAKSMFSFCVYGWRRDGVFLYIGCSCSGLVRVKNHNIINRVEPVLDTDEIVLWCFDGFKEASNFESEMIRETKPKYGYNGLETTNTDPRPCAICGKVFNPVRRWQKYCGKKCSSRNNSYLNPVSTTI